MKRIGGVVMMMALVSVCAADAEPVRGGSASPSGVIEEATDWRVVPKGCSDVLITASLKTHTPGVHSSPDPHGTPDYKVVLKIDGREVPFPATLQEEETETRRLRDAEAGQGVQYRFSKKVRLPAGTHTVVVAIPADGLSVEREISLAEGSRNTLRLEPVYRWAPGKERLGFYGATSYREGIKGFRAVLNEREL